MEHKSALEPINTFSATVASIYDLFPAFASGFKMNKKVFPIFEEI